MHLMSLRARKNQPKLESGSHLRSPFVQLKCMELYFYGEGAGTDLPGCRSHSLTDFWVCIVRTDSWNVFGISEQLLARFQTFTIAYNWGKASPKAGGAVSRCMSISLVICAGFWDFCWKLWRWWNSDRRVQPVWIITMMADSHQWCHLGCV